MTHESPLYYLRSIWAALVWLFTVAAAVFATAFGGIFGVVLLDTWR